MLPGVEKNGMARSRYLVMHLYCPKTEAPSILPPGEGTWEPPAIVVAK